MPGIPPFDPATLTRTTIKSVANFIFEEIIGSVQNNKGTKLPFRGYLVRVPKTKCGIRLWSKYPPQKMKQILANPDLSEDQKPLCAINGGFWTDACLPLDWCIIQGIESTKLTNQTRPCIIFCDNSVQIEFPEEACSLMKSMPTCSVLQTGPCLLYRGEIRLDYSDYQLRADEFDSDITKDRHPRTLFGYSREEYFFMVIDGRSRASIGLYLEECAALLSALGCSDAVNLDGGASSTMYFDGYRVNHPRFSFIRGSNIWSAPLPGKERPIPNAILAFPR